MHLSRRAAALALTAALLLPSLASAPAGAITIPAPEGYRVLSNTTLDVTSLDLAIAPGHRAAVAWVETDYVDFELWAAFTDVGGNWGGPQRIDGLSNDIGRVSLGVDEAGAFTLVYVTYASPTAVWVARAEPGAAFSSPTRLANVSFLQGSVQLSVSAAGDAFVTWADGVGPYTLWAAHLTAGSPANLTSIGDAELVPGSQALAADESGQAMAVWCSWNGTIVNITYARYAGGSWSAPALAVEAATSSCGYTSASADGAGHTVFFFPSYDPPNVTMVAAWYAPAAGWSGLQGIAEPPPSTSIEQASVQARDGYAVAAWVEGDMTDPFSQKYSVHAAAFDEAGGVVSHQAIGGSALGGSVSLAVAMGAGGVGLVATPGDSGATAGAALTAHYPLDWCSGWSDTAAANGTSVADAAIAVALEDGGAGWVAASAHNGAQYELRVSRLSLAPMPSVDVTSPTDGAHVASFTIDVAGHAPAGTLVSANGRGAMAGPGGAYTVSLALAIGTNPVDVVFGLGGDWAGCARSTRITVVLDDPIPPLLANLSAAQARVAALEASGNATAADLAAVRADLNATSAQLTVTLGDLASAQAALTASGVRADALSASINASMAEATALQLQITTLNASLAASQAAAQQARADAAVSKADAQDARSSASLALIVAVLGVVLGAVGMLLGLRGRRPPAAPAPPPEPKPEGEKKSE